MPDSGEIAATSLALLRDWPGYRAIALVLKQFSDLQLYLAGGVVRECVLEREEPPKDFDVFLGGPAADRAIEALAASGEMQRTPFGSHRWFPADVSGQYCDLITIARFTNGLGPCRDITDALVQFDFTGNALAVDLRTAEFFDPVGGRADMQQKRMRMIVEYPDEPIAPGMPISRVAVLWFRLLHYAAELQLEIEPATRRWLARHADCRDQLESFSKLFFAPRLDYSRFLPGDIDD